MPIKRYRSLVFAQAFYSSLAATPIHSGYPQKCDPPLIVSIRINNNNNSNTCQTQKALINDSQGALEVKLPPDASWLPIFRNYGNQADSASLAPGTAKPSVYAEATADNRASKP